MANPVTEILEHLNDQVARLSTTELTTIRGVLAAAEKELAHDLAKWTALGKGDDRFTPQMYRNALLQIRGTLHHIDGDMKDGVEEALKAGGKTAGMLALRHLKYEVETFSGMFEHSIRPVAFDAANVLAQGKKTLWPKFTNSAKRYAGQVGEDIRKQLAIGLVRGETIDQMTTRLAKLGGPRGLVYTQGAPGTPRAKAEYIAEGLFTRYRHYAERLAVTETVNAYNVTALEGMDELEAEDPGYFRRWDAAIDGRTCPYCRDYDDLVVPLDKPFPGGVDHPPLHPRCRCAVVVWRKEWTEHKVKYSLKDDLIGEGKKPVGVAAIPHRVTVQDEKKLPKRLPKIPQDGQEITVSAKALTKRGYFEPAQGLDPVKLEKAKKAIKEGQQAPVKMVYDDSGNLELTDGRHRLRAATALGSPIRVLFEKGSKAGKGKGLIKVTSKKRP